MAITVRFDTERMAQDIAAAGWNAGDVADLAGLARSTVYRFLRGDHQTPKTAKRIAEVLGHKLRRYIVAASREAVA